MLRFNTVVRSKIPTEYCISIHPMLRFNSNRFSIFYLWHKHFNTSYVTVQPVDVVGVLFVVVFQYILCYGSTSGDSGYSTNSNRFQYILCYGSTYKPDAIAAHFDGFQYILCYGSTNLLILEGFFC